jgi:hypothetical protein
MVKGKSDYRSRKRIAANLRQTTKTISEHQTFITQNKFWKIVGWSKKRTPKHIPTKKTIAAWNATEKFRLPHALFDLDLTYNEVIVLAFLAHRSGISAIVPKYNNGFVNESYAQIAKAVGIARSSAITVVAGLVSKKWFCFGDYKTNDGKQTVSLQRTSEEQSPGWKLFRYSNAGGVVQNGDPPLGEVVQNGVEGVVQNGAIGVAIERPKYYSSESNTETENHTSLRSSASAVRAAAVGATQPGQNPNPSPASGKRSANDNASPPAYGKIVCTDEDLETVCKVFAKKLDTGWEYFCNLPGWFQEHELASAVMELRYPNVLLSLSITDLQRNLNSVFERMTKSSAYAESGEQSFWEVAAKGLPKHSRPFSPEVIKFLRRNPFKKFAQKHLSVFLKRVEELRKAPSEVPAETVPVAGVVVYEETVPAMWTHKSNVALHSCDDITNPE